MFIRAGQAGMPLMGDFLVPEVRKAAIGAGKSASHGLSELYAQWAAAPSAPS
jgi:hypothetical protein